MPAIIQPAREIWLAMTDIVEGKSPPYIFIYASWADGPVVPRNFFANCTSS
jgi:hypothetical protein